MSEETKTVTTKPIEMDEPVCSICTMKRRMIKGPFHMIQEVIDPATGVVRTKPDEMPEPVTHFGATPPYKWIHPDCGFRGLVWAGKQAMAEGKKP